jgi:hypothetical protein
MSEAAPAPAVIVTVAVAFPLESKVTEFELSEQVGEPDCAGCTVQASDTGLSNAFSRVKVSVEVALWPGLTLLGLDAEAEIEKSVPVFSNTPIEFELALITIRSGALSRSTSARTPISGFVPAGKVKGA